MNLKIDSPSNRPMKNRHAIKPPYDVTVPSRVVATPQSSVMRGRTIFGPKRFSNKFEGSSMIIYGMNVIVMARLYCKRWSQRDVE